MPTFGSGNNKEYSVQVIAILHLVDQKGTAAEVQEAFATLVAVRKEMSIAAKEARKKKLIELNESLKAKKTFTIKLARRLTTVPLLHCQQGANAMGQDC
jgi:hypothetical protein